MGKKGFIVIKSQVEFYQQRYGVVCLKVIDGEIRWHRGLEPLI